MEPIRVLHDIVLLDAGGLETLVMNLYRHIDREKLLFDFLVHRPQQGFYEPEIESYGGKIFRTPKFNPLNTHPYKKACMEVLTSHPEYKVFHAHQDLNLWTLDYARQAGIPTRIAHAHNAKTVVNLKYFFFLYEKMFIKKHCTDMFMCSTPAGVFRYGKEAVKNGKCVFIKNGIETDRFKYDENVRSQVREELKIGDKIAIGHVGRFAQPKNHSYLLDIFKVIHQKNPNTVLLLCGEGKLEDKIKAKVHALGLDNDVVFLGVRKDTGRIYQAYDLFLFPSLWEGLPLTCIEAQTAGLPVIMSDVIATDTIVTNNVTRISLNQAPEIWADKVLDTVSSFERKNCQPTVKEAGFDICDTANWLQDFYITRTLEALHNEKNS